MLKKGQVTLFVIIGLVLVILVGISLYIISLDTEVPEDEVITRDYDADLDAVASTIEDCMGILAREFFEEIGVTGGFHDVDPRMYRYDLYPEYVNNALELFPDSELIVPYWFSIDSPPDCIDCRYRLSFPSLEGDYPGAIRYDAERYVEENMLECVDYFSAFEDTYDISYEEPSALISFYDEHTSVALRWDIEAVVHGSDLTLSASSFVEDMDLRMKKIYDLALDLLFQVIIGRNALDEFTREVSDVMGMGLDSDVPPRAGGVSYERRAPRIWRVSEAKDAISESLSDNIMYMQIIGSRDHFIITDEEESFMQSFYSRFLHSMRTDSDQLSDTSITFSYWPNWPMFLDVNPSMGDIVMPETYAVNMPMLSLSITTYEFDYDIAHPVLITLEDDTAFRGEGYVFQFAVESNIRRSDVYSTEVLDIDIDAPGAEDFYGFSDTSQRTIPVSIEVVDKDTFERLGNVSIMYTCLGQTIIVGTTEDRGEGPVLDTYMPACIDGYFEIMDDEYYSDEVVESIIDGEDNSFVIEAFKETEISFNVNKKHVARTYGDEIEGLQEYNWEFNNNLLSVHQDEELFVLFTRIVNNEPSEFIRAIELESGRTSGEVGLIPGEYELMVISNLYLEEDVILDDEEICIEGECHTIEGARINESIMYGYLMLDGSTSGTIEITSEDLDNDRMIIYYTGFRLDELSKTRHLEVFGALVEASEEHREELLPRFE